MKGQSNILLPAFAFAPDESVNVASPTPIPLPSEGLLRNTVLTPVGRTSEQTLIFAVDDSKDLTELYMGLLVKAGYKAVAFNRRAAALTALQASRSKPDLVITDYFGLSMPVDEFMNACRAVHPGIRILMASGFSQMDAGFCRVKPDRFIRKPFTPEEFLKAVDAGLDFQSREMP